MQIIVPIKQVPDLVEELEVNADGTDLDREYLTYVMNEFDEQALEEAVLLKEATGGSVTAVALDHGEVDNLLYSAAAKGADALVKVTGDFDESPPDTHGLSAILAEVLRDRPFDLILTGVQAADDLDGQLAPMLAARLSLPHASVVASVTPTGAAVIVSQEYGGGTTADIEIRTPAVVGVQAARQTPRYAPISRVRQMKQEVPIEEVPAPAVATARLSVRSMSKPESSSHAQMLSGSTQEIADRVVALLRERGLVKA